MSRLYVNRSGATPHSFIISKIRNASFWSTQTRSHRLRRPLNASAVSASGQSASIIHSSVTIPNSGPPMGPSFFKTCTIVPASNGGVLSERTLPTMSFRARTSAAYLLNLRVPRRRNTQSHFWGSFHLSLAFDRCACITFINIGRVKSAFVNLTCCGSLE
eukprot:1187774-Prorocentrum_minimum.AAC.2